MSKDGGDTEKQAHEAWERGDLVAARQLFARALAEGNSSSALNLGYFYDEGIGGTRSTFSALKWYGYAYRHGDSSGAINIAIVHRERGNWKAMLAWSRKACALGDGDAELDMAKCYLQGRGTLRSRAKALKHLRRAIRSSHISPAGREEAVALRKCIVPVFQLESKK